MSERKTYRLNKEPEGYLKLFRLLSAAKCEADALQLSTLSHFTEMALLQLVLDWEDLEPDALNDLEFLKLLREKEAEVVESDKNKIRLLQGQ
jgi:hypothetical protein